LERVLAAVAAEREASDARWGEERREYDSLVEALLAELQKSCNARQRLSARA
jgi:hypothetical protein